MATGEASSESLSQALAVRGWCIADIERVKAEIAIESTEIKLPYTVNSVESELLNMDLRLVGGRCLPDPTTLRKSSHLQGPNVLQVSSAKDVSRSSIDGSMAGSHSRRLLRLKLTDGHREIIAIEFASISALPNDLIPGTKVRLEEKCPVHCGILCLTSRTISLLGGTVQTLYEEWQINQKYSGSACSSSRISQDIDAAGKPPPFEKLQTGPPSHRFSLRGNISDNSASTSRNPASAEDTGNSESRGSHQLKGDRINDKANTASDIRKLQEKPNNPERPKEVAESFLVQNHAAAQKLLQKMNVPNPSDRRPRGRMHRMKEIEEDPNVLTLAEWEKKKAETNSHSQGYHPSVGRDEDLARQLQEQFDLENHAERGQQEVAAETIKLGMFNFERDDQNAYEMGTRGRGRGRRGGGGRWRGRGRGRGR